MKINLPSSKSLSNRALLLCALSGTESSVGHMSNCDDTYVMWRALTTRSHEVDIMAAGTAMRFLTAFFSTCSNEEHIMTGTERMRQRPIGVLVDALRHLGAEIEYTEKEGFPPLCIKGHQLCGGALSLPANVSSQYISALLMVAPQMTEGLSLTLEGNIISRPYIDMTLSMMQAFGADARWVSENVINVAPKCYRDGVIFNVESDWSAASYWYEVTAILPSKLHGEPFSITLPWLHAKSWQGDSEVQRLFQPLGVETEFDAEHEWATLRRNDAIALPEGETYEANLVDQPDLAQTLVVTCALLRRPFRFTGLRSLRIKETDRMEALRNELAKLGVDLGIEGDEALFVSNYSPDAPRYNGIPIATYHDHRMAMAFAPARLLCPTLQIAHPEVVSKSYPNFWEEFSKVIKLVGIPGRFPDTLEELSQ